MTPPLRTQPLGDRGDPLRAGLPLVGAISLAALAIHFIPGAAQALQWQRDSHSLTSLGTSLTSHLTHWSWDHLIWDLVAFVTLSVAAIRLLPQRFPYCLLLASFLIPLEILLRQSHLDSYRGLSGIDSAVFGLILIGLWRSRGKGTLFGSLTRGRLVALVGGGLFLTKCLLESGTQNTLFVANTNHDFVPAISAHVMGMLCGIASGMPLPRRFTPVHSPLPFRKPHKPAHARPAHSPSPFRKKR